MIAVNDPGSTRLVYAMVIGLVAVGIALVLLGVWLVRQTRYDPPVLAPLERMGDDRWRKSDPASQRRMLDELRPEGAEPLETGTAPPTIDAEFDALDRPVPEFDDLRPGLSAEPGEPPAPAEEPNDTGGTEESPESVDTEASVETVDAADTTEDSVDTTEDSVDTTEDSVDTTEDSVGAEDPVETVDAAENTVATEDPVDR